jgi:hypothetical protein
MSSPQSVSPFERKIQVAAFSLIGYSAITLLGGGLLLLLMTSWGAATEVTNSANPKDAGFSLSSFNAQLFRLALYLAVPGIVAGVGLFRYQPWARILGIIVSVFGLLRFPLGTIVGAYVIWVLVSKECTRLFESKSREEDPGLLSDTESGELLGDFDKPGSYPDGVSPTSNHPV